MCEAHYMRQRRSGVVPTTSVRPFHADVRAVLDRHSELDPTTDCVNWVGSRNPKGYGQVRVDYRLLQAHRVAYEAAVGPIRDGLELDHLCRNRACVNPDHLEPVTHAENVRRRRLSRPT